MNVMKLALLGTAALAAVSVSARADDLSALKAQIEALNSRISQLETAPSVPAGYQLLTISEAPAIVAPSTTLDKNLMPTATTIGILPTADMPASTNIQWSGYVRAALVYSETDEVYDAVTGTYSDSSDITFRSRARVNLTATTDTAVGEVGVFVRWQANSVGHTLTDGNIVRYYGWWKMTPEVSLVAGFMDSVGGVGQGMDSCTCNYVSTVGALGGTDDSTQFRLAYASGPISAAIAIENHDTTNDDQDYAIAAELKWAGDAISGEIAGFVTEENTTGALDDNAWQIGAGVTFGMDMITLTAAAGVGDTGGGMGYMKISALASAALSESVKLELGAGFVSPEGDDNDTLGIYGAAYWSPVSQLAIGAEVGYVKTDNVDASVDAAIVTIFSF